MFYNPFTYSLQINHAMTNYLLTFYCTVPKAAPTTSAASPILYKWSLTAFPLAIPIRGPLSNDIRRENQFAIADVIRWHY